jgi:hypothetical protein
MAKTQREDVDVTTAILDTQLLDVLAQVECLLRNAREVQRQLLRVRGVPQPTSSAQQRAAASAVRKTTTPMIDESAD